MINWFAFKYSRYRKRLIVVQVSAWILFMIVFDAIHRVVDGSPLTWRYILGTALSAAAMAALYNVIAYLVYRREVKRGNW